MPARSGGAYILDPATGALTRRVEAGEPMPAGDPIAVDTAIPPESENAPASDTAGGESPVDDPVSRPRRRAAKPTGD
ncbi:MAG TPA: hypothetical protein VLA00_14570 [Xanthobacteraceae bacterium]|nr:hypothetical protein [Xanthobacteraceae bacterium]